MLRFALGAVLATCLAMPAAAEVVETSGGHFVTRDSATVKATPNASWLALISPGEWWDNAHTWSGKAANMMLTPQGGGCFCERIPEKESAAAIGLAGSAQHMTVVMAEPMKVLRMRGGLGPLQSEPVDGVLTITMQPDKPSGGTKIVWEYVVAGHMRFPVATISKAVDGVMSQQLGHLAAKLGRVDAAATKAPEKPIPKPAADPAPKPAAKPTAKVTEQEDDVGAALDAMDKKPDAPK
ncbi:MAG: SRPBCC family protein [Tsuneonella sp.]